jgi:hypothetical protein
MGVDGEGVDGLTAIADGSSILWDVSSTSFYFDILARFFGDADRGRVFDRIISNALALCVTRKSESVQKKGPNGLERNLWTKCLFRTEKSHI